MLLQNLEQPICRDNGIPFGKLHDALYNSLTPSGNVWQIQNAKKVNNAVSQLKTQIKKQQ